MNEKREAFRLRLARWIAGKELHRLASVSARVDDSPGWGRLSNLPHDYDAGRVQEIYQDALEAWRKNPIAWRIVSITSDYVVGDSLRISSPNRALNRFIQAFWYHPRNRIDLRLESMCDELARAGDLFPLLFRNPQDGMSYIRFVTKDRIQQIETAPNDWESELSYHELPPDGLEPRQWLSPLHPDAPQQAAIMLHYAVNRPLGALLGESDLTTMIPWLLRYSRMLEDRVRLHWATRMFLWLVTVPSNQVGLKQEQYRQPPDTGAIVVKDESEQWQAVNPSLHGADSAHDLKAVRGMIDAGSGYPPHWRGEPEDANLATATAMQAPTERHLMRRQQYLSFVLQDILYHAYQRYAESGRARPLNSADYASLFTTHAADISPQDNESLGRAAGNLAGALATLNESLEKMPASLKAQALRLCFEFAGAPLSETELQAILQEMGS